MFAHLPTKILGGGGASDLEFLVASVVGHWTVSTDRSVDQKAMV
jgi:hypothetical protein